MYKNKNLEIPILLLIYNRPRLTQLVFNEISKEKPTRFFIAADGPKFGDEYDKKMCKETRKIIEKIDWECDLSILFREQNLGCRIAVSSAIDWFFENVEEGIILEDDCLPHPSFFKYCEELLSWYENNNQIMIISGNNLQFGLQRGAYSYYFSRSPHTWGWATWRRAWQSYDGDMKLWPYLRKTHWLEDILANARYAKLFNRLFNRTYSGLLDTWDYQWVYSIWIRNGITILPNVNLVSNIGFGEDATHTKVKNSVYANIPIEKMNFPLQHPLEIRLDYDADRYYYEQLYTLWRETR